MTAFDDTIIGGPFTIHDELERSKHADKALLSTCEKVLYSKCSCKCERFIGIRDDGSWVVINCRRIDIGRRKLAQSTVEKHITAVLKADAQFAIDNPGQCRMSSPRIRTIGKVSTKLVVCFVCMKFTRLSRFKEIRCS